MYHLHLDRASCFFIMRLVWKKRERTGGHSIPDPNAERAGSRAEAGSSEAKATEKR